MTRPVAALSSCPARDNELSGPDVSEDLDDDMDRDFELKK